jgi:hypothetical protein
VRERQVATLPEPQARSRDLWNDVQPLLDEELSRLPDKYRVPIVLCDLEEHSIKEAAQQLGWPQGTLAGRLARARVMLAKRLARQGLAVSGGVLATLLSQQASSAALPGRLVSSTVEAAKWFAAGQTASGLVSAGAVTLTEGVLQTMLLTKLKIATAVLLVLAVVALSTAGAFYQAAASDAPEPKTPGAKPPTAPDPLLSRRPVDPPLQSTPPDAPSEPEKVVEASELTRLALPTGPMPRQALVGLEKEHLLVRTLDVIYEPVSIRNGYEVRTSYQMTEVLKTRRYQLEVVKVYDVHGQRLRDKQLPKLLKKETVALISSTDEAADPLNLRLFKEGTLLFIIPSAIGPQPPTYYEQPTAIYPQPVPPAPIVSAPRPPAPAPLRSTPSNPPPATATPPTEPRSPVPAAPTVPLGSGVRPAPTPVPGP